MIYRFNFINLYTAQGSGIIKAGFAGEEYPKVHFAN